ncbi:HutD/Ves family protein [Pseudogemmobacter bohemicus]|uniref:HutD/Ves family protein n=1 Tax=Pseudogemmobacter bohemicus TaxID=2250708 RepID=UPI0018E59761|nr:HutD family protein [Pseudogemmobacter bohemicus]
MTGIYPASDRVFRPWKNGGGETAEILVSPVSAGSETFSWRVSTAWVATDGPFSAFPGIDRVLTVIEGGPMLLETPEGERLLDENSPPFAFPGEVPVTARLRGPALLDFNVMCRRPLQARVSKGPLPGAHDFDLALLLAEGGGLQRLDLVDFRARRDLVAPLADIPAIGVRFV